MSSTPPPRAYTTSEKESNAKFYQYMADARSGKAKPPPEWVPQRSQLETAVRRSLGIEDPEAPVDTSPVHMGMSTNARQAWESFSDAEQLAIRDDHDPELTAEYERRKNAAIAGEEEEGA